MEKWKKFIDKEMKWASGLSIRNMGIILLFIVFMIYSGIRMMQLYQEDEAAFWRLMYYIK